MSYTTQASESGTRIINKEEEENIPPKKPKPDINVIHSLWDELYTLHGKLYELSVHDLNHVYSGMLDLMDTIIFKRLIMQEKYYFQLNGIKDKFVRLVSSSSGCINRALSLIKEYDEDSEYDKKIKEYSSELNRMVSELKNSTYKASKGKNYDDSFEEGYSLTEDGIQYAMGLIGYLQKRLEQLKE